MFLREARSEVDDTYVPTSYDYSYLEREGVSKKKREMWRGETFSDASKSVGVVFTSVVLTCDK